MTHVLAILGLGAACILWFLIQQAAGHGEPAPHGCGTDPDACDGCAMTPAAPARGRGLEVIDDGRRRP